MRHFAQMHVVSFPEIQTRKIEFAFAKVSDLEPTRNIKLRLMSKKSGKPIDITGICLTVGQISC